MNSITESVHSRREEQAKALCLRLLTARARTRFELSAHLTKRGYPDEVSDRVLERLAAAGLVDDADFAEQWVRSRRGRAGKGRRVLAAELRARGIDETLIAQALDGINPEDERDRAGQLVRAKLRRQNLDDENDIRLMRRLVEMLVRRGYSQAMACDTVSAELTTERERRRV